MPRYFTRAQAEQLLPRIEESLRQIAAMKKLFDEAERTVRASLGRIQALGGAQVDRQEFLGKLGRRDALGSRLREFIESVEAHGCVVKDLDLGLIDFPTLFRGEEVFLCWKVGEPRIEFWHPVDTGFRGRKAIDQDFLDNHCGE